ncbi:HWE histidine kinase domain-containing protein [Sphingosinicella rhizophila]|uniref:histidine kinase n=1 Tax=Sphingosinicella rhizophila TaxID=3050082 RepID=A0ABU3Q8U6_9SPHN|nr:HWE histidine kinase domain-containing protein [Sphingosinicella sp. GR2756]MDT9599826.1 HWE histidine kinase domain-containing protein [Sphingosinicella sp. GR2756]
MSTLLASIADKANSDVYISDRLNRRPRRPVAASRTSRAMQELAGAMAKAPATMLPRFVELAMELTGAVSAGLSLYEPEPAPGLFRWRHLHGNLAPFEGATTPRDDSPCGVTLDRDEVTLSSHPERAYDWIAAEDLVIPEVLLVPLHLAGEEPLGTLWVVAAREGEFHRGHADTLAALGRFAGMALKMIRQEENLRAALDEQELLAKEMSHRLKNLFAMTDGMIRGSARKAETVEDLAAALSGRLHALADAHSMVQRKVRSIGGQAQIDLGGLIRSIVRAHEAGTGADRLLVDGPPIFCGAHAINGLALVIHELATNAAKYGALSNDRGLVEIGWRREGEDVVIDWRERGGPPVAGPPDADGFGALLVTRTIERQFRGRIAHDWAAEGLSVSLRIPAARLSD